MNYKGKELIEVLGFSPKENTAGIFQKKYSKTNNYSIEINFDNQTIYFGGIIKIQEKDSQNITKPEDWVVLECVNLLLETGYNPKNISLEKVYPSGHGTSGRLDICVTRDDGSEYLLIECKTYGKEFDKEFTKIKKNGGQLFTYFKFSNKADLLMLYASQFTDKGFIRKNEIIKIEDKYRIGDVKDFYNSWNKVTKQQGVWENPPYDFKNKIFTKKDLIELNEIESTKIFHEFASILRKHSVSDKPNAFNKIFNLFLAKLYDEAKRDDDELEFRWREDDNAVDFQVRLINLHKEGLFAFLQKEIEGIDDKDFKANSAEELLEKKKKVLKFNNILAIKEVLDDASFDENQRVLKDVVKLLEKYQIRYPRKQQHLSDFFEKLLTTGLKQEVGQYFTPPPITKFIARSLPIKQMIEKEVNKEAPELPAIIDYAAGSGHFITEAMEEYQDIINAFTDEEITGFYPKAIKQIKSWQADPYEWAAKYVYGIEKDYRLVKVAKVGCYFYGDGVAQIIHGDGLDSFKTSKTYKGLLKENTNLEDSTKAKFSLVLSNPPYSVDDCKDDLEYIGAQNDFTLYPYFTDDSNNIECLFVERTKHLLKDGGIAAIVLPNPFLHTSGIQTKAREIILRYFEIVAIAEFGKNTFMATSTNTVTFFLKRKNNQESVKLKDYVNQFCTDFIDNSINEIERPVFKYINYVWSNISFDDYVSLLKKEPNKTIVEHEIYKEYYNKIKRENESNFWSKLIEIEKDKLLHFIMAYPQKNIVLVKSGEKEDSKRFLGFYFSGRRGHEGMHSIQKGKSINDCTKLYNANDISDLTKASSYINNAFLGKKNLKISKNLENNISYVDLLDMIAFDRADFDKSISLSIKKKVKIESKWEQILVSNALQKVKGNTTKIEKFNIKEKGKYPVITQEKENLISGYTDEENSITDLPIILFGDHSCSLKFIDFNFFRGADGTVLLKPKDEIIPKYFYSVLNICLIPLIPNKDKYERHYKYLQNLYIPLAPSNIQQKIVVEIENIENNEKKTLEEIEKCRESILNLFNEADSKATKTLRLSDDSIFEVSIGKRVLKNEFIENGKIPVYSANVIQPFGSIDKLLIKDFSKPSVLWGIDGDWMVNYIPENIPFYPTDHCGVLRVKDDSVNEKYLAFILEKEGKAYEFSRTKRASIDRIQGIKITVPSPVEQKKVVTQISKIEKQISELEIQLAAIPKQKEVILKKYLS